MFIKFELMTSRLSVHSSFYLDKSLAEDSFQTGVSFAIVLAQMSPLSRNKLKKPNIVKTLNLHEPDEAVLTAFLFFEDHSHLKELQ